MEMIWPSVIQVHFVHKKNLCSVIIAGYITEWIVRDAAVQGLLRARDAGSEGMRGARWSGAGSNPRACGRDCRGSDRAGVSETETWAAGQECVELSGQTLPYSGGQLSEHWRETSGGKYFIT